MAADKMMDEIWEMLPRCNVAQLVELCTELSVPVLDDRKGNKRAVFNIVNRHLTNPDFEDPDTGLRSRGLMREKRHGISGPV